MAERYASLKQGLVGAWIPSVSGSGLLLPDLSGRGNNGVLTNMAADDWVSSQYGRALDFDGSDDVARVVLSAPTMPFSISCWALTRSDSLNQFALAFCRSAADDGQFSIRFAGNVAGDPITCRQEGDAGGAVGEATFSGFLPNQWYHVAAIFRSNTYRQIYVNGVAGTESTTSITTPSVNRFAIGRFDRLNPAVPLNGQVDDARVYSRELTESEIRLLASRPGIGLRQEQHRQTFYQFPSGSRRRLLLTGQT
jgi:hypothetical protein